jgi:glutamyl-tRNA synthetase
VLTEAARRLGELEGWDAASIEQALRALGEELELKPKAAFAPIRIALTGRTVAPGLFESAALLGRDEVLARLSAARALLG